MAITVNVKSMEEVPDYMREFVTENDGVFSYDSDRAFAALKAERDISKTAKSELAPFKALNITPDQIKAFQDIGKTPSELAEIIAKANAPAPKPNVKTTTEYLELEQRFKNLEAMQAEWEATKAENLKNKRNGLVRKLISEMPDEYDKELFAGFVESSMMERFALNDTQDGLSPVDNMLPAEFLKTFADKYHFKKESTPGKAAPGNAPISATGTAFTAVKSRHKLSTEKQAAGKMRFKTQEVCCFLHFSRIAKGFMRRVNIRHLTNIRFCVILQPDYVGLP